MTDLTSLIDRVEKATSPDRHLDARICWALGLEPWVGEDEAVIELFRPDSRIDRQTPRYTSSIDAAVSLAERVLPGCFYLASNGKTRHDEPLYAAQIMFGTDQVLGEAESDASLAVAIVAATLRALQSKGAA